MRQVDLANAFGKEPQVISRWTKGESLPTESNLETIARLVRCDVMEFFKVPSGDEDPTSEPSPTDALKVLASHFGLKIHAGRGNVDNHDAETVQTLIFTVAKLPVKDQETALEVIEEEHSPEIARRVRVGLNLLRSV